MHSAIEDMLKAYDCRTTDDCRHALNEIVQEIALLGLYRGGFFAKAAFYGGTALRIFYGLDRFSEDLDFSLLKSDNRAISGVTAQFSALNMIIGSDFWKKLAENSPTLSVPGG